MTRTINRTVAIIDILGFAELIESKKFTLKRIYDVLLQSEEFLRNRQKDYEVDKFFFDFSNDRIVITSASDTKIGCDLVIHVAKQLLQQLITVLLPARGAVAFGEIYATGDGRTLVGEAYLKAHKLEETQEWIGLSLDESIGNNFPELISELEKNYDSFEVSSPTIVRYPVPVKNENIYFFDDFSPEIWKPDAKYKGSYIFTRRPTPRLYFVEGGSMLKSLTINEDSLSLLIESALSCTSKNIYAVNWLHGISNISMIDQIKNIDEIFKNVNRNPMDIRLARKYHHTRGFIKHIDSISESCPPTKNAKSFSIKIKNQF